jgi:hypothetical protein
MQSLRDRVRFRVSLEKLSELFFLVSRPKHLHFRSLQPQLNKPAIILHCIDAGD